mgnify:CR=1 FL=1
MIFPAEERNRILSSVEANGGFMREFVEDYLRDVPADIRKIEEAILARDADKLERSAHGLKSVVGLFQAMIPYEIARDLETFGKEGDFVAATLKFKELRGAIHELNNLLGSTL